MIDDGDDDDADDNCDERFGYQIRPDFGERHGTSVKDEARRKRMEELLIRREKWKAERGGGKPVTTSSLSSDKSKFKATSEETKKPKPVLRSSTIDRLAATKTTPSSPAAEPKREASKVKGSSGRR